MVNINRPHMKNIQSKPVDYCMNQQDTIDRQNYPHQKYYPLYNLYTLRNNKTRSDSHAETNKQTKKQVTYMCFRLMTNTDPPNTVYIPFDHQLYHKTQQDTIDIAI